MFKHARGINLEVELIQHDATRIGDVFASIDGEVALVTDPPYFRHDLRTTAEGIRSANSDPLEPFLQQVAAAPNVSSLLICYRINQPILPFLDEYFAVTVLRGTKGRSIHRCRRKSEIIEDTKIDG